MIRTMMALLAACLASSCVASIVTAPIRAAADVTGDVVRGTADVVTPGDRKEN